MDSFDTMRRAAVLWLADRYKTHKHAFRGAELHTVLRAVAEDYSTMCGVLNDLQQSGMICDIGPGDIRPDAPMGSFARRFDAQRVVLAEAAAVAADDKKGAGKEKVASVSQDLLAAVLYGYHFADDEMRDLPALGITGMISLATFNGKLPSGFSTGRVSINLKKLFEPDGFYRYVRMVESRDPELKAILARCGKSVREFLDGNELVEAAEQKGSRGRVKSSTRAVGQRKQFDKDESGN